MSEQIWKELCQKFGVQNHIQSHVWQIISQAYQEKHRFYHNFEHLENIFGQIQEYQAFLQNKEVLLFTTFFHDLVYQTHVTAQNEVQSAEKAQELLSLMKIDEKISQKVSIYILATEKHSCNKDNDLQYFLDMDLSILGTESRIYQEYTQKIRKEYAHIPEIIYKAARKKILTNFLKKTPIFSKLIHLEEQARQNLTQEILKL